MTGVPWGYVVPNVVLAGATASLLLPPPRRHGALAAIEHIATMVLNEIPHLVVLALLGSSALAWAQGDLASPGGLVGLAVAACAIVGLLLLQARAPRSVPAMDDALELGLGDEWRLQIAPDLADGLETRIHWIRALLFPFRRRRRDVEHLRDLSYGDHGRYTRADLYRHRSRPVGSPVLVHLHGGAFRSGRKDHESLPLLYHFASRGWLVVSANYRVGRRVSYPEPLVDLKRLLAWIREHGPGYGAAPALVVVVGDSAGAHLAMTAALTPGDPDLQPGFETADTSVSAVVGLYGYFGRSDGADPSSSPAGHLHPNVPPVMLVHGDHDTSVPVAWTRSFARELAATSTGPVVYAELPGAQHTFDLLNSVRAGVVADRVEAFTAWVRTRARASDPGAATSEEAGRR